MPTPPFKYMWNWGRATLTSWLFIIDVPKAAIFKGYIVFFDPEKSLIAAGCLPELMAFPVFYNTSPFNQFPRPDPIWHFHLHLRFTAKYVKNEDLPPLFPFLDEFYKIAFRKKIYLNLDELQTDLDEWLVKYNNRRTHQGKRCQGRTPMQTFMENLPLAKEKM